MAKSEPLESQTELYAKIAKLSGVWSELELNMCMLFAAIIRVEPQTAITILNTLSGTKLRRDIIQNVANLILSDLKDKKSVEKILKRHARAAKVRNTIFHSVIAFNPDAGDSVTLVATVPTGRAALMTSFTIKMRDLNRFEKQFRGLAKDVYDLTDNLRGAPHVTLHGTPFREPPPQGE